MSSFKPGKPQTPEGFRELLKSISGEVVDAHIHFRLFSDLITAFEQDEYQDIQNESNTFWWMTIMAHFYTTRLCLCRVFDQEQSSLHLLNFLKAVKASHHLFSNDEFQKRLEENEYIEELTKTHQKLDESQLEKDLENCDKKHSDLVYRLYRHRNTYIAHNSGTYALKQKDIHKELPLEVGDFENLLEISLDIVNRYSSLFNATSNSTQMVGHDDYKYLLNYALEGLNLKKEKDIHSLDA